jgi:flagella basal body P-ring formation protein FlgA
MKLFLYILLFLQLIVTVSHASNYDRAYIERLAKTTLETYYQAEGHDKISIKVSSIDPRIKVQPCQMPLKANIPEKNSGRNVNVKISCDDSISWKMYLPAKVEITSPILVAKKTISKGSIIDKSHIEIIYMSHNKIRGAVINDEQLVLGAKAEKRIAKGKTFNPRSICLVCKGDIVTIIAKTSNFSIKTQGEALSSGNINEQVRIKNSRSNKVIIATVKGINNVVINL